jgi:hypothetical protein
MHPGPGVVYLEQWQPLFDCHHPLCIWCPLLDLLHRAHLFELSVIQLM